MTYSVDPNAKNVWIRDNADTMDLSVQTEANSVYFNNGRTMEQEFGKGTMVSNIVTVDSPMEKVVEGTYDGTHESCKMYGKSLVNVMTKVIDATWNLNLTNWSIETTSPSDLILKPNTMYSVIVYVTEKTCPDRDDLFWVGDVDGNKNKITHDIVRKNVTLGANVFVINTVSDFSNLSSNKGGINFQGSKFVEGTLKWKAIVLEGDWTDKEVPPYFTGLCDVKMPILKNTGKNLLDISMIENGNIYGTTDSDRGADIIGITTPIYRTRDYIKILPNTTYSLKINKQIANEKIEKIILYNTENHMSGVANTSAMGVNALSKTFTTSNNSHWLRICFTSDVLKSEVQLEESPSSTSYEPYKTSILTTSEEVILRKVGDVCDSYDALTGECIRRIGEVVLDGSENWQYHRENGYFWLDTKEGFNASGAIPISDRLIINGGNANFPQIPLFNDAINSVSTFKEWLSNHPTTMQYKLANPITTTIEPSTIPFVYENGHILLESGYDGQSLLPTLEYSTVINRTGQIQSIANTVQKQEKQITKLEQMLIQNIVEIDYNNTLLTLGLEINEVI